MIQLNIYYETIYENIEGAVDIGDNRIRGRCPFCGDSKKSKLKKRFNITYNNGSPIYKCFNCDKAGNFVELYAFFNDIEYDEAFKKLYKFDVSTIKSTLNKSNRFDEKEFKENNINCNFILDDCISLENAPSGIVFEQYKNVLEKFTYERKIVDYPLYIAYKGQYKGRIIIPIYENGDIIYFQGRIVHEDGVSVKYRNPRIEKEYIILNRDKFDINKDIVITEGIIDALQVTYHQGTCVMGASLDDIIIKELYKYTKKNIIIALDNDERGMIETSKILKKSEYSHKLLYFFIPDNYKAKDLGELNTKYKIDNLYDFIRNNSYNKSNAKLKLKMGILEKG